MVVEIVDHHLDMGGHAAVIGAQRNVAFDAETKKALVGSACTLVAEVLSPELRADATLATLLGGVILIDTLNMDPAAAKVGREYSTGRIPFFISTDFSKLNSEFGDL